MTSISKQRLESRKRRHHRVRKKITGTPDRPAWRLPSNRHLVLQVIDDVSQPHPGRRLDGGGRRPLGRLDRSIDAATSGPHRRAGPGGRRHQGRRSTEGGFLFHGRIKAAADAARESGLSSDGHRFERRPA
jgi:large subunit ribosomal protein L18